MVEKRRVCVTGGGGYQASWLIKLLLSKGYKAHAPVRDPDDEKDALLKRLDSASENLQLFKADLLDYDILSVAINGCTGVFHVMEFSAAISIFGCRAGGNKCQNDPEFKF